MAQKENIDSGAPQSAAASSQNTANSYQDPMAAMAAQGLPASRTLI